MRERTLKTYMFDELSEKAQETALENFKKHYEYPFFCEDLTDLFNDRLAELGLPNEDVQWSLSYSQGDGVAFYGSVDVETYLEKNNLRDKYAPIFLDGDCMVSITIKKSDSFWNYNHANTMVVYVDTEWDSEETVEFRFAETLITELEERFKDHIADVSHELEQMGYDHIEYINGDEFMRETLICREEEYTADGIEISSAIIEVTDAVCT